jgi:type VI protein secretion system component Hcp
MKNRSGMDPRRLIFSFVIGLLVLGVLLLPPSPALAQTTGYMQIVGTQQGQIRGDSKDPKHQGWIEIISLRNEGGESTSSATSLKNEQIERAPTTTTRTPLTETPAGTKKTQTTQNARQPGASSQPQSSGSQLRPGEVIILKKMDKASPPLFKAAAAAEPLKEVVIELRRSDGKGTQRLTLEKVIVSSIRKTQAQGKVPEEELTLRYQKLTVQDF